MHIPYEPDHLITVEAIQFTRKESMSIGSRWSTPLCAVKTCYHMSTRYHIRTQFQLTLGSQSETHLIFPEEYHHTISICWEKASLLHHQPSKGDVWMHISTSLLSSFRFPTKLPSFNLDQHTKLAGTRENQYHSSLIASCVQDIKTCE